MPANPALDMQYTIYLFLFVAFAQYNPLQAQNAPKTSQPSISATNGLDPILFSSLKWRNIGPYRGGRSAAVCGVRGKSNLFYMGATGGGVWRTRDGGSNWQNISDGFFGGSIGAVAVSDSDPNVLYVGGGESTLRGNVSAGYGMFKSTDAGKTWTSIGLPHSRQIARIRIDPQNPDLVYVAVIGNIFAPDNERGVYRTQDGGKTWQRILFVNADAGATDLILDPTNPRILYATTWRVRRLPYSFESGGEGSGIWKSTDGGDTWQCLTDKRLKISNSSASASNTVPTATQSALVKTKPDNGLPEAPLGISCIAVSPANPERVWAMIEAKDGGLYRSDNGGTTWKRLNEERSLRQRAWYFSRIVADPTDADVVYVLNVYFHKSKDGGKTFSTLRTPHPDHHDFWIDPDDAKRMIVGDDGGAQISFDGGANWSSCENQPTGQFYRVSTDNSYPYRILAAQQDNNAIRISHQSDGRMDARDWEDTAGGESGYILADPTNPDIVYGGSYDGYLTRYDHFNRQFRAINVYPDNPMGHGAIGFKYRFQWNFPLLFSPHNPRKLYAASNHLHVTYDEGHTWQIISPDLTRNDSTKMQASGGIITKDNTSVEYYCTIFAIAESPRVKDLIWAGSDDGLLHLTRNGGETWQNVTPKDLPAWTMINAIEPDPHHDGGAYIAATAYKSANFAPYIYRTKDYGKTWTKITQGIAPEHFTRVVRCDPVREGLLYCGTESGMYVSFNDGKQWQSLQLNLPTVPITDLCIKDGNLIATTQGRGIWIIDDLTVLQQTQPNIAAQPFYLYRPADTHYSDNINLYYYLHPKTDTSQAITLSFWTAQDSLVQFFTNKPDQFKKNAQPAKAARQINAGEKNKNDTTSKKVNTRQLYQIKHSEVARLSVGDSTTLFTWSGNYPEGKKYDGMVLWWAGVGGAQIIPGQYTAQMTVGKDTTRQTFMVRKDPRAEVSDTDYVARLQFLRGVTNKVSQAHETIAQIRDLKKQLNGFKEKIANDTTYKPILTLIKGIDSTANIIEEALHQPKSKSGQDPINFPIRLNNKLAHLNSLVGIGNYPPTVSMIQVRNELTAAIDQQIAAFDSLKKQQLPLLNQLIREKEINMIWIKEE